MCVCVYIRCPIGETQMEICVMWCPRACGFRDLRVRGCWGSEAWGLGGLGVGALRFRV